MKASMKSTRNWPSLGLCYVRPVRTQSSLLCFIQCSAMSKPVFYLAARESACVSRTRLRCSLDPCTATKKTKEHAAFTLGIPVRLSTQIDFRRINFAGPGLSIHYSTVQYSTVQYSTMQTRLEVWRKRKRKRRRRRNLPSEDPRSSRRASG